MGIGRGEEEEAEVDDDPCSWQHPHAFHLNLPPHHIDEDGIPLITKYAYKKSRHIMRIMESMELTESMFVKNDEAVAEDMTDTMDDDDDDDEEDTGSQNDSPDNRPTTLSGLLRLCSRLQSQISALESLKFSGLSRMEISQIVLQILKLLSATVTITSPTTSTNTGENGEEGKERDVTIHYDNVGYICGVDESSVEQDYDIASDPQQLEDSLKVPFALPSPARELMLSMLVNILSNKGPLRSVSNAAIYPDNTEGEDVDPSSRFLLIIHWKSLLRMLLRTAPYLDELKVGTAPMASNSRQNTTVKRTVQMIRDARHFFDQGLRPNQPNSCNDKTAIEVWDMVKNDVMNHSHTHACYRSLILLYLFQPSRCTSTYYLDRVDPWFESWSNIDRCPEIDFLWLALLCRARKHLPADYDWGPIRRKLLTHCQYWLQLPIGGATMDKNFPNASTPRSRSCPSRLKVFAGASSSYEEGIDFVAKVAKLLVIGLGRGAQINGVSEGTRDVLRFLSFATPYFNPSNLGSWTFTLGAILHYFCYEICCRIGTAGSMAEFQESNPKLAQALSDVEPSLGVAAIPPHELVLLMDALLPLCQQALYSKNGHVGRAGEAAMLYLSQIDPARVTPAFIDFATRALDITAVNLAHQAPAALSALTRLLQPALRSNPRILLVRLPDLLRLTLAGIDSNDQNKTIRTLILYRSLTSWLPVGGSPTSWKKVATTSNDGVGDRSDGTMQVGSNLLKYLYKPTETPEYTAAIEKLSTSSLLRQGSDLSDIDFDLLVEEASSALCDWVLEFLERIYALLRAMGEREKAGKTASGVASRHSSADVQQARNFSRVLKECLTQTFAAMDDEIHQSAVKSVARFLTEESLPSAAKDASFLCQAVCAARISTDGKIISPGLDALLPVLMDDLEHHSSKTLLYRIRCVSGSVRSCGSALTKHKREIFRAVDFALSSKDKHVYKSGCKLLRHTLATLCESYVLPCDAVPRGVDSVDSTLVLGRSAQLHDDPLKWHVPDTACVQFAWELLEKHVINRIRELSPVFVVVESKNPDENTYQFDVQELRRCLRVIRYALRGGSGILLDLDTGSDIVGSEDKDVDVMEISDEMADLSLYPVEQAMHRLLQSAPPDTYQSILNVRGMLSSFVVTLSSLTASETFKAIETSAASEGALVPGDNKDAPSSDTRRYLGLVSSDTKVCKEVSDIALLLLTRRGASFRSQEGKTIWKAQKQLATDFALLAQADHMVESLQRAQAYGSSSTVFFKDGECAGKTLPRRLLVSRIQLFHDSLQRTASFEVPRRLRRLSKARKASRNILFSTQTTIVDVKNGMSQIGESEIPLSLTCYEGIVDGLFSLCCHSNTQVRASAIGVVDYAITRFGWLLKPRVPRLLAAIQLNDNGMHGKFGLPSTASLKNQVDGLGKRKRLAEAMKGVCSVLAIPRGGKQLLSDEKSRFEFIKTICGTEDLVSLMPPEEMQKMVHYLHSLFSPFRLKFYSLPRSSSSERKVHKDALEYLLTILNSKNVETDEAGAAKAAHWRKLMLACWFLTVWVDEEDLAQSPDVLSRLWKTCFKILEEEYGQPLQRVALGLFGRLVMMTKQNAEQRSLLREQIVTESFCTIFGKALVYDHKEDSSIGGGHDAQWAAGIADMIRDSARNVAPRSLFPFQRTNQSSGTFKVSHAQLVEQILLGLSKEDALSAARYLVVFSKEMASSPPSEDQRNQQCTSAEIFAGVGRAFLQMMGESQLDKFWESDLLPFLEEAIPKIPISLSGAYFDSVRFAIQFSPPRRFYPMTRWLFGKIEGSLWVPKSGEATAEPMEVDGDQQGKNESPQGAVQGTDGFTAQSKWLYICCAVLVELDETEAGAHSARLPWYAIPLAESPGVNGTDDPQEAEDLKISWKLVSDKLLPRLIEALGHPYESCRDHIAGCLFRICYCHRKMSRGGTGSNAPSRSNSAISLDSIVEAETDPGSYVVQKLLALQDSNMDESFQNRYNSLITARRFFSYCIHFGEAKHEYANYIIPLLPLAFEALKSNVEESGETAEADTVAKRALEAEIVKGYRYTIAEVSVSSVISYGGNNEISRVLAIVEKTSKHEYWQVRHASANFLRCFQGSHKFLFTEEHAERITSIVVGLLGDDRREVSSAAMAAVTGIIAALPADTVATIVKKYVSEANKSRMKRKKKPKGSGPVQTPEVKDEDAIKKEQKRARMQQTSVFFLCAAVLSQPYDTPPYVPKALASISKHSFERSAPLGVRDIVKKCCGEYKRTHMSDNWEVHRQVFTQEELEALEDVVSSPHYYA